MILIPAITPVSYTHLDVYKRQVVLPASLPVYRNSLLDAADNTDAMKARLRTVLDLSLIHI